jgi:hypothetical protein
VPHDPKKPDVDLVQHTIEEPMPLHQRRQLQALIFNIVRFFQAQDTNPDVALTALLNVAGSIIGTVYQTQEERDAWVQQFVTMLPFYTEAYRTREKKI